MAMMNHQLTIRFEIHEGDVRREYPWPLGHVAILEVVEVLFIDGQWEVTSAECAMWIGRAMSKNAAILEYLKTRLGIESQS